MTGSSIPWGAEMIVLGCRQGTSLHYMAAVRRATTVHVCGGNIVLD